MPTAGTPQCLVGGGGHHIRIRDGGRMLSCGNKACNMRHIHKEIRADFFSQCGNPLEINHPRISRSPATIIFGLHSIAVASILS